jgi:hypothetical protein
MISILLVNVKRKAWYPQRDFPNGEQTHWASGLM